MKESFQKKFSRKNPDGFTVAQKFYDEAISRIDFNTFTPQTLPEYKA
jgi:hypothetical protein